MSEVPSAIWIGLILAVFHMALCCVLLTRVREESRNDFEELGEFHLIWNNTPQSTVLFWKWLCSTKPHRLSTGTRILVWVIRATTLAFLCWFGLQILSMFLR